ncbi:MAG: glycoside hydrolase family 3 N-terminal domain-containing protein [Bacteroidia bacterium]
MRIYPFLLLVSSICLLTAFTTRQQDPGNPVFESADSNHWVDSVFATLSPERRIGQLFMVAAYSNKDKAHVNEIKKLITEQGIGGLIFFQGGPKREANLCNLYQGLSEVPLLISIDGEWGLAMRLDSTVQFPRQMTLGAIQDDSLIYEMGKEIARECRRMGIQVNLAPVADINNNPNNPVISNRSFGENKYLVARKAGMYMKGMQDAGVLANAKHFPGHGDTDSDSHKTLPVINQCIQRMDTLELYPFRELFRQGLGSVMVAHLNVPCYDTAKNMAATLSPKIVNGLLKDTLGFKGLIFTDALNMRGVAKFYAPGLVDLKALLAGNDVLLFSEDVPTAIEEIKKAMVKGLITQEEIDKRCRKILKAKYWCGLAKAEKISLIRIYEDLNNRRADLLNRKLADAAMTVLKNDNNLLPLKRLDTLRIATVSLGYEDPSAFDEMLNNYMPVSHLGITKDAKQNLGDSILRKLKDYNTIILCVNNTNNSPKKDFGLSDLCRHLLDSICSMKNKHIIVDVFANPYLLTLFKEVEKADAVVLSYEWSSYTQNSSAALIFGGIGASGKIPVSVSPRFPAGTGINTGKAIRFKYTVPEEVDIDPRKLKQIDTLAWRGIKNKAYPGCQILVAKDGKVFYRKSFGYHTYAKKDKVRNDDIYDIASVTKIMASTPALMKLVDEKSVRLNDRLSEHLPEIKGSNKQDIIIREMMAHQAGLKDWLPFWMWTMEGTEYKPGIYSKTKSDSFPLRVADRLYIRKAWQDTMFQQLLRSPMGTRGKFVYSDLGYYFIKRLVETNKRKALNIFVDSVFYKPIGLQTMGYKPRERFDLERIIPTEYDLKFRKQQIQGDVHDQGAAMMGGVGGHAGLFSDANDVAVMMQLYMNKGTYGGVRYLDSATINDFTRCQYCVSNRRGAGFDKPETDPKKDSPVCDCVSYLSFGHQGFTGTITWADPASGLVYVFLSNRVYPDADDNRLLKQGTRTAIMRVLNDAVSNPVKP